MTKRLFIGLCVLIVIIGLNGIANAQEVSIPDPNLASAVRNAIDLPQETPITQQLMLQLTALNGSNLEITDLTGLEHATNLRNLNLNNNQISDLTPLAGLTELESLSLESNQISDLTPLAELTSLLALRLSDNQISNIRPLSELIHLEELLLDSNEINNIVSLHGLTQLIELDLADNQIRIVTPLRSLLKLEIVNLSSNRIESIRPLYTLTNLEELYITNNPISDISQIHDFIAAGVEVDFETAVPHESQVALTRVLFNEIRNASNDRNDWIELRNISNRDIPLQEWEISILINEEENDIVTFPNYMFPAGGILLIVNTDPRQTTLLRGKNINTPNIRNGAQHHYLVADKLKLPNTQYMLILRSAQDKNGTQEAIEDVAGTHFFDMLTADQPLTEGTAWERSTISEVGYNAEAWEASGYKGGIGYQPVASEETSHGTPGYSNDALVNRSRTGQVSISEVMFFNKIGNRDVPQWIELYNNSHTEALNLNGWKITIEARHGKQNHYVVLAFRGLDILPNQTVLLVSDILQASQNIPTNRVYNLRGHHPFELAFQFRSNNVLSPDGFFLQVLTPDGTIADTVGNLDGNSETQDTPTWELPSGIAENGVRSSMLRRYHHITRRPLVGTEVSSWQRAVDVKLGKSTYWGDRTDIGNPGYTLGGVLPVDLSYFRAERTDVGVVVKWTTESELDNAGFNILRSETKNGTFKVINTTLIQGAGTTGKRHTYTWTDTTAKPNVMYYYRIEDVSFAGIRQQLTTVRMKGDVSARGKSFQTWGNLKAQ